MSFNEIWMYNGGRHSKKNAIERFHFMMKASMIENSLSKTRSNDEKLANMIPSFGKRVDECVTLSTEVQFVYALCTICAEKNGHFLWLVTSAVAAEDGRRDGMRTRSFSLLKIAKRCNHFSISAYKMRFALRR